MMLQEASAAHFASFCDPPIWGRWGPLHRAAEQAAAMGLLGWAASGIKTVWDAAAGKGRRAFNLAQTKEFNSAVSEDLTAGDMIR